MQGYFASFITTGDPNTLFTNNPGKQQQWWEKLLGLGSVFKPVRWGHPVSGKSGSEAIRGVLDVGDRGLVGTAVDGQVDGEACDFWLRFAGEVTKLGGYAPLN